MYLGYFTEPKLMLSAAINFWSRSANDCTHFFIRSHISLTFFMTWYDSCSSSLKSSSLKKKEIACWKPSGSFQSLKRRNVYGVCNRWLWRKTRLREIICLHEVIEKKIMRGWKRRDGKSNSKRIDKNAEKSFFRKHFLQLNALTTNKY